MYDPNNIFAKIIRQEVAANKVYEDDKILAIFDINPVAPVHVLVMPKGEFTDFNDFVQRAGSTEVESYFQKIFMIANKLEQKEYRLVTNIGENAGQTIFHFHTHILAGRELKDLAG